MNKKTAVALAVGTVFATPALAQMTSGSGVEIYGRLYPQVEYAKGTGATDPADNHKGRFSVDTMNSRIGFRGRETLGGGLNAIWQIETRVRFDTGSGNVWAGGRDSFLGMSGGFGTVRLGNMDTIYKQYGAAVGSFFGISSGNFVSSSGVLSEIGFGGANGVGRGDTGFHIRAPNSIQYETPEFGGFQAGIQYSPDEAKGNPNRLPTRGGNVNAYLLSMGVKYEAGPVYASLQHERHNDWFDLSSNALAAAGLSTTSGTLTGSKDQAWRASGSFAVTPQHKLTGDLARMEWKDNGPGGSVELKRTSWAVGWEARWGGPWRTELTYTRANSGDCSTSIGIACDTTGLDGRMWAAGVGYSLSKRTLIYGIAAKLTNGEFASFDNSPNGSFGANPGEDVTRFAVGMSHSF